MADVMMNSWGVSETVNGLVEKTFDLAMAIHKAESYSEVQQLLGQISSLKRDHAKRMEYYAQHAWKQSGYVKNDEGLGN